MSIAYLLRRLATVATTLFVVVAITFLVFRLIPGDPVQLMIGADADPALEARLRREFGTDSPAHVQFFSWTRDAIRGDFGTSIRYSRPVADLIGARPLAIVFGEILPNVLSPLLVAATIGFGTALLSEAGLSSLGLGIQPPDPSWGRMLREAQGQITRAPWLVLGPGAAITMLVLGFYLLGNGIRDVLDPRASKGVR